MNENTNIVAYDPGEHNAVVSRNMAIIDLKQQVFQVGIHFGEPYKGAGKPTLLKPGAELIMARFKLWPKFIERTTVERWDKDAPLFHYRYECQLIHRETAEIWGAGIGSCNSMEDKYRWRKADRVCPSCGEPKIIKSKYPDKRTGDVGWYCLACKSSYVSTDAAITQQESGRVPNDDIFTLVNTLDKMSQKRALVAAVLVATGASAYFTQDVEDFAGYSHAVVDPDGEVIEGTFTSTPTTVLEASFTGPAPEPPAPAVMVTPPEPEPPAPKPSEFDAHFGPKSPQTKTPKAGKPTPTKPAPTANAYDPAIDGSPLTSASWEKLSGWLRYNVPELATGGVNHVTNTLWLSLTEQANALTDDPDEFERFMALVSAKSFADLFKFGLAVEDVYRAICTHYDAETDAA